MIFFFIQAILQFSKLFLDPFKYCNLWDIIVQTIAIQMYGIGLKILNLNGVWVKCLAFLLVMQGMQVCYSFGFIVIHFIIFWY